MSLDDPPRVSNKLRIAALLYVLGLITGVTVSVFVALGKGVVAALSMLFGGGG